MQMKTQQYFSFSRLWQCNPTYQAIQRKMQLIKHYFKVTCKNEKKRGSQTIIFCFLFLNDLNACKQTPIHRKTLLQVEPNPYSIKSSSKGKGRREYTSEISKPRICTHFWLSQPMYVHSYTEGNKHMYALFPRERCINIKLWA